VFERRGQRLAHRPAGNLAFNSMEACVEAASAGLGVTQVLSALAHGAIRAGRLAPVLIDWAAEGPALYLVYPPNRQQSARIRAFAAFAAGVFAAADAGWREIVAAARRMPRRRRAAPRSGLLD
jgi:DNA-binding transcriptional LysR family regulator